MYFCDETIKFYFLKKFLFHSTWISWEKENTEMDHFHGNGPYCKIPTKNQPIRVLRLVWELLAILSL